MFTADEDYVSIDTQIRLTPSQNQVQVPISLPINGPTEPEERFEVLISIPSNVPISATLSPNVAEVTIIDLFGGLS